MMQTLLKDITFPDRNQFKKVELVAVYIEPRVDSGERICVGVVALQAGVAKYTEVPNLKRLRCLYGTAYAGLIYAGELALKSLSDHIINDGFENALASWVIPAQGIFLGKPLTTSSSTLDDALRVSLSQFSSLYAEPDELDEEEPSINDGRQALAGGWQLARLVKDITLILRPGFEGRFDQKRRIKDGARPMRLGYVGEKLVANFGMLTPKSLSAMVSTSKAKLWDLAQAREGTQSGWFKTSKSDVRFELFVHKFAINEGSYTLKQKADIAEAMEELEVEADKLEVRCIGATSPVEIAKFLVAAES